MRMMLWVRISIWMTALLLIIGLIVSPARSQSGDTTSAAIVCQCLQIEQTGSGETSIDLFVKLDNNGWMRMGGINANTEENTPESITKTFKNRILMGLRVNFPEAFSSDEEGDKLKLRAQPVDPTNPTSAWEILVISTADLLLSIKAQTDGESFMVSTQNCKEEDLNPPDIPDDVERGPPTEDEETESEVPEEAQEEQQPERDEEESVELLPVGEPPRFISKKGLISTKIDPKDFEFRFELKTPDTRTVRCGEGGKDRGKCRIIYTATVLTRPVTTGGGKLVDLAYHWEIDGRITIDAQSCTCELQVFEDLDSTSVKGITRNKATKSVSNCQNAKFLFRSGWKSISENFPDAEFADAATVTLDFAFKVDKQCEGCREIRTPKKSIIFGKTTYTGSSNIAEDPPIFTDPISQGALDPSGDCHTKLAGLIVPCSGGMDIETVSLSEGLLASYVPESVNGPVEKQLLDSMDVPTSDNAHPQSTTFPASVQNLTFEMTLHEPLPTTFEMDSVLNRYSFFVDADGDPNTGFKEEIFPDFGADFTVTILNFGPAHELHQPGFISGVIVWNPAKSGGDQFNSEGFETIQELTTFDLSEDRKQITFVVDVVGLEQALVSRGGGQLDLDRMRWFAWNRQTTATDNLGIIDVAPDSFYTPLILAAIKVPGDFANLQDAINAATSGETILIGPGTYRGDFIVSKSLTIQAEIPGTVTLQGIRDFTLLVQNTQDVLIEGLTITGAGDGLPVFQSKNVTLRNNSIERNGEDGVVIPDSGNIVVENNRISNNGFRGILAFNSTNVSIVDNTVSNNVVVGIAIQQGNAEIRNNTVSGTKRSNDGRFGVGLFVLDGGVATITGNTLTNNVDGIWVIGASADIRNNTISDNAECGVFGDEADIAGGGNSFARNRDADFCDDVPPTL